MTLDLKSIFANDGATLPFKHQLDMTDVDHSGAFPLKKPVRIEGSVSNRAGLVELFIKVSYSYENLCDRCGILHNKEYTFSIEKALAVSIEGEEIDTIEDVLEPYLIQQGYFQRTPRGRIATTATYRHFGIAAPSSSQTGDLWDETMK